VLGVCRRILRNAADADDAFQATFLVLARRAAVIQPAGAVGPWLHGVAFRTAREAFRRAARRRVQESRVIPREPTPEPMPDDFRPVLDAELDRLPRHYAEVLVLCDMEDRPRREVAAMLAVPEGTIASRLSRARDMLAERLNRRGLGVSAGVLATAMTAEAQTVPPALIAETTRSALGTASASVAELAKCAMGAFTNRIKLALAAIFVAALGVTGWAAATGFDRPPEALPVPASLPEPVPDRVAEAPPPADPIERAKARLTGTWRIDSGTKEGQPLTPWEKQGLGIDLAANGIANLQRLQIRDLRTFTWSIENSTTIVLTPPDGNIAARMRIPFEMHDDQLTLSWTEPQERGGPRRGYLPGSYRLTFKRISAAGTARLAVAPSPQNAVGNGLLGTWEWEVELNRKLGSVATGQPRLTFLRDDAVANEVPETHRDLFEGKRIYLAGRIKVDQASYRFLLIEHLGNPLLVYFVPKTGNEWHCEEAVTVALAAGAKPDQDLLFLSSFEGAKGLPAGAFRRAAK